MKYVYHLVQRPEKETSSPLVEQWASERGQSGLCGRRRHQQNFPTFKSFYCRHSTGLIISTYIQPQKYSTAQTSKLTFSILHDLLQGPPLASPDISFFPTCSLHPTIPKPGPGQEPYSLPHRGWQSCLQWNDHAHQARHFSLHQQRYGPAPLPASLRASQFRSLYSCLSALHSYITVTGFVKETWASFSVALGCIVSSASKGLTFR